MPTIFQNAKRIKFHGFTKKVKFKNRAKSWERHFHGVFFIQTNPTNKESDKVILPHACHFPFFSGKFPNSHAFLRCPFLIFFSFFQLDFNLYIIEILNLTLLIQNIALSLSINFVHRKARFYFLG